MKKKNGFTLVELLAVVAIIAILILLAMPNIMKMFNQAKKKSFITEVQQIYKTAQQQYMKDSLSATSTEYAYAKSSDNIKCSKELMMTGRGEIRYFIELDRNGKVIRYYATDGEYQFSSEEYGLKINDIEDVDNIGDLEKYEDFQISCDGTTVIEDTRVATLETGPSLNVKMKKLAGQTDVTYHEAANTNVKAFKRWIKTKIPSGVDEIKVSISSSDTPIYMWFDNGTIYYYSKTKNVYLNPNSSQLFRNFIGLEDISGIANFNTSKVTTFYGAFQNLSSLTSINVSNLDTSNVEDMRWMFAGSSKLTHLNVSNFNTSNVKLMTAAFGSMTNLKAIDLSSFDTSNVTDMSSLFSGNKSLESINLSGLNTSKVTNMSGMFSENNSLKTIDLSSFNTSNVTNMSNMFSATSSLESLNLSNFNTSKVTNMSGMFSGASSLKTLDLSTFNTSNVTDMSYMFSSTSALTNLNISSFNTSKVTTMRAMFRFQQSLKNLDLSHFDTSSLTNMSEMFFHATGIETLDMSSFNTSKVTSLYQTFRAMSSLKTIDISNFDTSNVTSMFEMFNMCTNLETIIGIENINTSKVTVMAAMFESTRSLKTLDLSNWDVSNVTNFGFTYEDGRTNRGMFQYSGIETVDLSNWTLKDGVTTSLMFESADKLKNIYVSSNWDLSKISQSTNMFNRARNLPNYNSSVVDKTNAHYNTGGYFTLK